MTRLERMPKHRLREIRKDARKAEAYDTLRWRPWASLADRARAKAELGLRRTHPETLALACELLDMGRMPRAVADELGITDRHLRRVLTEPEKRVGTPENTPRKPSIHAAVSDTTCKLEVDTQPPPHGFANFAELDAWLDRNR